MSHVPLAHWSSEPCIVSWSEDQRVAVTTNEEVHVLTLKVPLGCGSTYDPSLASDSDKRTPLFILSTAVSPIKSQLCELELGGATHHAVCSFPPAGNWPFMEMVDPVLQPLSSASSCDLFKNSGWTPLGCNAQKGCLLTCLTQGGRLLLYAPPTISGNRWLMIMVFQEELGLPVIEDMILPEDLTAQLNSHLLSCNFNHKTSPQEETTLAESVNSSEKEPEPAESANSAEQEKEESKPTVNLSSDYVDRKCSLTVTAFAWLPIILMAEVDGKMAQLALVAVATRRGHVVLMGIEVPLVNNCKSNVMTLQVIDDIIEDKGQHKSWVCSLKWTRRENAAWLAFGCTDGRVGVFHWQDLYLSLIQPSLTLLWKSEDSIPVFSLAWDHKNHSPSHPRWLAAAKGSLVVVFDLMNVPNYSIVTGIHSVPVTGISSFSSCKWRFISTSLDGTVQTFEMQHGDRSHANHVTPQPVTLEVEGSHPVHGVALSKNGLFGAFVLDRINSRARNKNHHQFQVHFVPLVGTNQSYNISEAQWNWDLVEHLRRQPVEQLATTCSKLTDRRVRLHRAVLEGKGEEGVARCMEELLCQHIDKSLNVWLTWSDSEQEVGGVGNTHSFSTLSLSIMCQCLSSLSKTRSSSHRHSSKLVKKVTEKLVSVELVGEMCPACDASMPFTNSLQETCENGHCWKRCGISLTLVLDPRCSSCMQCGAVFNNAQTIPALQGSWLEKLLDEHTTCLYCDGHFELVM